MKSSSRRKRGTTSSDYISTSQSGRGDARALSYIERIESYCRGFADFPERGKRRDDLVPGLRLIGFERRVTIAFHVDPGRVTFDRVLYAGRELPAEGDP